MITLKQAVVVEGKYDKIKLANFIDAPIITTEGFGIFKNRELQRLLRRLAETNGLVVLTDSDSAGFLIRNFIGSSVGKDKVINAYIPDILGKEKRKDSPSKEGTLGVEGMSEQIILDSLERAGVLCSKTEKRSGGITKIMLWETGISGGENSAVKRKKLLEYFGLPARLSANGLIEVLNCITTPEGLMQAVKAIEEETE